MTSATELRARRDLFRQVLNRLSTGQPQTRVMLFQSNSAQTSKLGWQRDVMRYLVEELELLLREGPPKNPTYRIRDAATSSALKLIANNAAEIDLCLQKANKWALLAKSSKKDVVEDNAELPEALIEDSIISIEEPEGEQGSPDMLESLLKYAYMTAQAVIDIGERLSKMEQALMQIQTRLQGVPEMQVKPDSIRSNILVDVLTSSVASVQSNEQPRTNPKTRWPQLAVDVREAAIFLEAVLGDGPVTAPVVRQQASQNSISLSSLTQALKAIRVVETRSNGVVSWSL